jgi:membrane associated rhomboid family serine protease
LSRDAGPLVQRPSPLRPDNGGLTVPIYSACGLSAGSSGGIFGTASALGFHHPELAAALAACLLVSINAFRDDYATREEIVNGESIHPRKIAVAAAPSTLQTARHTSL